MAVTDEAADRDPVEALAEEFLARRRRGEPATPDEYASRFPDLAERIRSFFPAVQLLEEFSPPAPPPKMPERLGEFRIIHELGRGGMGVVYEAEQTSLGRRVALKVLPPHAARDAAYLARFAREARTAAKLHHTNIVPVHGVGEQDGVNFLAMQLIRGAGLDAAIADLRQPNAHRETPGAKNTTPGRMPGRLSEPGDSKTVANVSGSDATARTAVARLAALSRTDPAAYYRSIASLSAQAADALAYAHAQGVVHRDIKPGNLLLDDDGTLWVSDFGLAKATGSDELTQPGFIVGTPRYVAPERFDGIDSPAGDVYALGATLYELLTGRPAFEAAERAAMAYHVCRTEPAAPRSLAPDVPRDLETVCLKCLEKDPKKRYAAGDLASDLRRFVDGRPVRARRIGPIERLARWARRNPAVAALTIGLFVVLTAGLAASFTLWRQSEHHRIDAVNHAIVAEEASHQAETQRDLANARLDDALGAVNQFFTQVSETTLLDVPGLQPLRKELLQSAAAYYTKFLTQRANDPALAVEVAEAHLRLGKLRAVLGERDAAADHYRLARDVVREPGDDLRRKSALADAYNALAVDHQERGEEAAAFADLDAAQALLATASRENPDDYELHDRLARVAINRGNVHDAHRRMAEAVAEYETARTILTPWQDKRPNDPKLLDSLAVALNNLGTGERNLSKANAALERYAESRKLRERLEQVRPGRLDDGRAIAMLDRNVGNILLSQRKYKDASAAFDRAHERLDRMMQANPLVPGLKIDGARTTMQQCLALVGAGDLPAAHVKTLEAVSVLEPLAAAAPADVPLRSLLAETIAYGGKLQYGLKQWDLALAEIDRSIPMWEALLAIDAPSPAHMDEIVSCHATRGQVLRELQRWDDALAAYDEAQRWQQRLIAVAPTQIKQRRTLGKLLMGRAITLRVANRRTDALTVMSEAVPLLAGDGVSLGAAAKEAAQLADGPTGPAADLAVKTLQAAAKAGWKGRTILRTDPAFAVIRDRAEVKALLGTSN